MNRRLLKHEVRTTVFTSNMVHRSQGPSATRNMKKQTLVAHWKHKSWNTSHRKWKARIIADQKHRKAPTTGHQKHVGRTISRHRHDARTTQKRSSQGDTRDVSSLRSRQNGCHFADDTFKHIFLNENVRISIEISLKFVPKGPINNIPSLVLIMAWRRPGDKPLSEPMVVRLPRHICVTRSQSLCST